MHMPLLVDKGISFGPHQKAIQREVVFTRMLHEQDPNTFQQVSQPIECPAEILPDGSANDTAFL